MQVISKYVEIDESEFEIDFKSVQNQEEEGVSSQIAMNIPIKKIKQMVKRRKIRDVSIKRPCLRTRSFCKTTENG